MAIRKIIYLPDSRLRKVSSEVTEFNDELQVLIDDMFDTMYDAPGVGLAAPQVGINLRLSVVDVVGDKQPQNQLVLINPVIVESKGEALYTEGCLSVPGPQYKVKRAEWVRMRALDRLGNPYELAADGLLGECFQHEIDHLDGKLYIDLLSPLKRSMARKKMDKYLAGLDK